MPIYYYFLDIHKARLERSEHGSIQCYFVYCCGNSNFELKYLPMLLAGNIFTFKLPYYFKNSFSKKGAA